MHTLKLNDEQLEALNELLTWKAEEAEAGSNEERLACQIGLKTAKLLNEPIDPAWAKRWDES